MKIVKLALISLCFLTFATLSKTNAQNTIQERILSVESVQKDFDILRNALEEAHGGLYRFSSKREINQKFDFYRTQLNKDFKQYDFISLLSEMLAELRDGHMRLEYDQQTNDNLGKALLFPFAVLIEGEKLKILYNDCLEDSTISTGMEIMAINGLSAKELTNRILSKISGDGFVETGKKKKFETQFSQYYYLFIDQSAEFEVTLKDFQGNISSKSFKGVLSSDRQKNRINNSANRQILKNIALLSGVKNNISVQYFDNYKIALLKIRHFDDDKFAVTLDSVCNEVLTNKSQSIILDLRGNFGGVDMFGVNLVAHFTDKPFRYFDRIHLPTITPSFTTYIPKTYENLRNFSLVDPSGGFLVTENLHPGVALQNPVQNPFLGKLIVLIDGGTFSTGADVTAILRQLNRAIFIGEETGGTFEGNISGLNALVKLPNSKLNLKIHLYEYFNAVSNFKKGRGTLPDYVIERKTDDLLKGYDKPLEKAFEILRDK